MQRRVLFLCSQETAHSEILLAFRNKVGFLYWGVSVSCPTHKLEDRCNTI